MADPAQPWLPLEVRYRRGHLDLAACGRRRRLKYLFRTERGPAPATSPAIDGDVVARRGAHPRHILRRYLSEQPSLYLPLARRRYPGPSPMVVTPDTQLVVDGYTRSATTYAVYAFQVAQPKPVRVAHHLHAPAQIVAAARWGIPTILLIRDPEGAVLSQVVREPGVTMRDALISWRRFYQVALRRPDAFVVGGFGRVTANMGGVIRDLNGRFGTSFAEFERTEEHERRVLALMGERPTTIAAWSSTLLGFESGFVSRDEVFAAYERFRGQTDRGARATWIPSPERDAAKQRLGTEWADPMLDRERARAYRVYEEVMALAAFPGTPAPSR